MPFPSLDGRFGGVGCPRRAVGVGVTWICNKRDRMKLFLIGRILSRVLGSNGAVGDMVKINGVYWSAPKRGDDNEGCENEGQYRHGVYGVDVGI